MNDLEAYGFQINLYDQCVSNKIINNKHMTVVWHVDDSKVSHANSFDVTTFLEYLSSINEGLTVHRGKVHSYLVIELDYIKQVKLRLSMIKYLDIVLQESPY